ncbi:MAG: FAD binding domain-containing protein, partial [Clostridiales Family XIII bacterium]|nr:FAD binding domain-containing protein [Clostridiales Family XIII bacterium]
MYFVDELYRPSTLAEALDILSKDEKAIPMAGGTDIIVKMRAKRTKGVRLVSLSEIGELREIAAEANGDLSIGACSTFTDVAENPLIGERIPMLKAAALSMGGPQTQNAATIGGNVCNGAVSADSAPSLLAIDAGLELISLRGTRTVARKDFYAGPGKVNKDRDEILKRIILPIGGMKNWGGSYIKMSTRKAMDISTLGSAAVCVLDEDGIVLSAAIALGTAGPTPMRCPESEEV